MGLVGLEAAAHDAAALQQHRRPALVPWIQQHHLRSDWGFQSVTQLRGQLQACASSHIPVHLLGACLQAGHKSDVSNQGPAGSITLTKMVSSAWNP